MTSDNETAAEAIAAERHRIECAKADAEDLEIECEFTDEEVVAIIDRIESAYKREIKAVRRNAERKMQQIVRQMQFAKGDVVKCEDCSKTISWDEYAVNFGWCDDCMNRHLEVHGLA